MIHYLHEHWTESEGKSFLSPAYRCKSGLVALRQCSYDRGFTLDNDMKICGIYLILNTRNNKRYIGQSVDCLHRLACHKNALIGGYHDNDHLQKAFNKYGKDAFDFSIIEVAADWLLDVKEAFWINEMGSDDSRYGYNKDSGGKVNRTISEEAKRKMSEAKKGKPSWNKGLHWSEEMAQRLRLLQLGKHHTEETKAKMSRSRMGHPGWNKGRKHTEEHKAKISLGLKGRVASEKVRESIRARSIGNKYALGLVRSPETRLKMSIARRARITANKSTKEAMCISTNSKTVNS